MGFGKNIAYMLVILGFFILNSYYILENYDKLYFSNTALVFFLIILFISLKTGPKNASETEKKTSSLIDSVPKQRYEEELKMAKRVQEGLLSVESPEIPGIKIVKRCIPAESVGGDFYSFVSQDFTSILPKEKQPGIVEYYDQQDSHLGIILGDVAGHGVSSALIMALSSGVLTEMGKQSDSPEKILGKANQHIAKYIENSQITHVTVFYGSLNTNSLKFTYSRAGHPPPILIRKKEEGQELNSKGVFLGLFDSIDLEEKEIYLKAGDKLFFYTDGISETQNQDGDLYGNDRLLTIIKKHQDKDIETCLNLIFDDVDGFSNFQKANDDRTMVILEIK